MRLWLFHSNEVSIVDQIVTQISLGILSGELAAGERLPSIRELARRFHIHPNTVSAGYRRLEQERWIDFRRGSGVYVRSLAPRQALPGETRLPGEYVDSLIAQLIDTARKLNVDSSDLRQRFIAALDAPPAISFLLIEPDVELQRIVVAELKSSITLPVLTATLPLPASRAERQKLLCGTIPIVLPSKCESVRSALPSSTPLYMLRIRSIPDSLTPWLPAPKDALIGVVSAWPRFLDFARTMLVAAGFHSDSLIFRDAREENWRDGMEQADAIVCDVLTSESVAHSRGVIVFRLIADESLTDLRRYEVATRENSQM